MSEEKSRRRTGECSRHPMPFSRAEAKRRWGWFGFYVNRCAHLGNRFVEEIRAVDGNVSFVDYVEDIDVPPGHDRVIVEAHNGSKPENIEALWERLTAKMRAGEAPDPDDY